MLVAAALAIATKAGEKSIYDAGPQGFSETLYAYTSQTNNNGSAFAGYTGFVQPNAPGNEGATGVTFADLLGGVACCSGASSRCWPRWRWPGRSRRKRIAPAGPGTFRTDTPTFLVLLVGVVVIVAALTFLPALAARPGRAGPHQPALLMRAIRRDLLAAVVAVVVLTVCFGLVYPLVMTGVAQVAFTTRPTAARSSVNGKVVGSSLIGQDFPGKRRAYFQSRPSRRLNPARHLLLQPRAQQKDLADLVAANLVPTCAGAALHPRPEAAGGAGPTPSRLRLRGRPAHLRGRTPASRPTASPRCAARP